MTDEERRTIELTDRYNGFTLLNEPITLAQLCEGKKRVFVQLHDVTVIAGSIIGFCGALTYDNGKIIPEDGDSYSENMKIWGYEWFEGEIHKDAVNILVSEW